MRAQGSLTKLLFWPPLAAVCSRASPLPSLGLGSPKCEMEQAHPPHFPSQARVKGDRPLQTEEIWGGEA